MTPFYVAGALLAAWALTVSALGLRSHSFPSSKGAERAVAAVSVVLVLGAVGTGLVTAASEEHGDEAHGTIVEEHDDEQTGGGEAGGEGGASGEAGANPDEGEEAAGVANRLELTAAPSGALEFDEEQLESPAGRVEIVMHNPSPIPHNVAIEGDGADEQGRVVGQGEESTVAAELEPGEYTFYCSVEGHREGGMEGMLVVR